MTNGSSTQKSAVQKQISVRNANISSNERIGMNTKEAMSAEYSRMKPEEKKKQNSSGAWKKLKDSVGRKKSRRGRWQKKGNVAKEKRQKQPNVSAKSERLWPGCSNPRQPEFPLVVRGLLLGLNQIQACAVAKEVLASGVQPHSSPMDL